MHNVGVIWKVHITAETPNFIDSVTFTTKIFCIRGGASNMYSYTFWVSTWDSLRPKWSFFFGDYFKSSLSHVKFYLFRCCDQIVFYLSDLNLLYSIFFIWWNVSIPYNWFSAVQLLISKYRCAQWENFRMLQLYRRF